AGAAFQVRTAAPCRRTGEKDRQSRLSRAERRKASSQGPDQNQWAYPGVYPGGSLPKKQHRRQGHSTAHTPVLKWRLPSQTPRRRPQREHRFFSTAAFRTESRQLSAAYRGRTQGLARRVSFRLAARPGHLGIRIRLAYLEAGVRFFRKAHRPAAWLSPCPVSLVTRQSRHTRPARAGLWA